MIRINLLPPEKKEPFWQSGHFLVIAVALFVLCIGSAWGYLLYAEYNLTSELQRAKQQHELLKPTLAQMQAAAAKQQAITARQTVLLTLTQERPPLYAAVARFGVIIPEGVWLTEVTSDKNSLKVLGMAKDYPDVAKFLKKVQEDEIFTDFTLVRTEQDKDGAKFEFTVKIKRM